MSPEVTPEPLGDTPQAKWWAAVRDKDNVAAWRAANEMALALALREEDEPAERAAHPVPEGLREALTAGMAHALTQDWPGDTRRTTAPLIVEYLLALPDVQRALASTPAPLPDAEGLDVERLARALVAWAGPLHEHGILTLADEGRTSAAAIAREYAALQSDPK